MAKPNLVSRDNEHIPSQELALSGTYANPLDLSPEELAELEQDAGKGLSQRPEDNIVPTIRVLQANSPECNAQHPKFVVGAEPGAFLYKSAHPMIIKANPGLEFIPSVLSLKWLEFRPRHTGGGFAGSHSEQPIDARLVEDQESGRKFWRVSNRNEVAEFRFRYGYLVHPDLGLLACALQFTGTGHSDCRAWEALMNELITDKGKKLPAWTATYRIITRPKTNAKGTWFGCDIQRNRKTTVAERNLARVMFDAYIAGKTGVDESQVVQDAEFTPVSERSSDGRPFNDRSNMRDDGMTAF